MCVLDVIFNYFFIFPTRTVSLFGVEVTMPGLGEGVAGAALGSLLSFVCVALSIGLLCNLSQSYLSLETGLSNVFVWRWQYIWNAMKIGAPMALQYLLMNGAQTCFDNDCSSFG